MNKNTKRLDIYNRLRQAREFAGLSQAQAAKLLKLHRPTITEIEAGRRRVSAEELSKFAEIYDVDVSWVLDEEKDKNKDANIQLAARELSKLKKEDREIVMSLLQSMRSRKGKKS